MTSGDFLADRIAGRNVLVAIDGPAESGKSSVAQAVAERLGFAKLDTGATYRAVALAALGEGVDLGDGAALAAIASDVNLTATGVFYRGERILEEALRTSEVSAAASRVSAHAELREVLVERQRTAAREAQAAGARSSRGGTSDRRSARCGAQGLPLGRPRGAAPARACRPAAKRARTNPQGHAHRDKRDSSAKPLPQAGTRRRGTRHHGPLVGRCRLAYRGGRPRVPGEPVEMEAERLERLKQGASRGMSPRYRIFRHFMRALGWLLFGLTVHGAEKVPKEGPLIVASNHRWYADPFLIGMAMPRKVQWMAKKELFVFPFEKFFYLIGSFPVDRNKSARAALKTALELLAAGWALGIFPEGTRRKTHNSEDTPKSGVAMLAARSGAPILPVSSTKPPPLRTPPGPQVPSTSLFDKSIYPKGKAVSQEVSGRFCRDLRLKSESRGVP